MLIKFPIIDQSDTLDLIKEELDAKILLNDESIDNFLFQLRTAEKSLNTHKCINYANEKKKLVQKLTIRCEHLKQRNTVIRLCEDAEDLANASPTLTDGDIAQKTKKIRSLIDEFIHHHRPSNNNMKFLRFAIKLLEKAKKHQKVLYFPKKNQNEISFEDQTQAEISLEDFSLAENLYELASYLYEKKIDKFLKCKNENFSTVVQKEIYFHAHKCGCSLDTINKDSDLFPAITGILGYAHTITDYYAGISPYPSKSEIEELFSSTLY